MSKIESHYEITVDRNKARLTQKTKVSKNKIRFMPGRSNMEAIFSHGQLTEIPKEEEKYSYVLH